LSENYTSMLVRLPAELKAQLQREAFSQNRSLTAEVVRRLNESFASHKPVEAPLHGAHRAEEPRRDYGSKLSDSEAAMLAVFKKMPPEKQLALLSLFK
jgi:Arc-like DNA binding dprotein